MLRPLQLQPADFEGYPPKARALAWQALPLLRQLPPAFIPFLLKEILSADAKFPAELRELTDQLAYLQALPPAGLSAEMKPFAGLTLNSNLEAYDWLNSPGPFLEQLSAHLWATHQMDVFRTASEDYVHRFHATLTPVPLPVPRAVVVVVGQGVPASATYQPFQKLRREGVLYTNLKPDNGVGVLHAALAERAGKHPSPYGHWYLHGGAGLALAGFSSVSYLELEPVRAALAGQMLSAYQSAHFDPEALRSSLARATFESLGVQPSGDIPLDRFALSLLTEGSGTQIYSTTFVQWGAREALRRAQPLTLFAHYTPRLRERSMAELLSGQGPSAGTDPEGSLIDADMGAYYTWLNQQRLPGAADSRFLAWFESRSQAVLIAPGQRRGSLDTSPVSMEKLAGQVLSSA